MAMEPRRFGRSKNQFLFGVCAGLAEYTGMNVTLMRVLWVVFAVLTWFWLAAIAYVVLAFVMSEPQGTPEGDRFWRHIQGRNVMVVLALLLICTGVLIIAQSVLNIDVQRYLFPAGLIVGGALLMAFAFRRPGGGNKQA
jgi:phage shock protein C